MEWESSARSFCHCWSMKDVTERTQRVWTPSGSHLFYGPEVLKNNVCAWNDVIVEKKHVIAVGLVDSSLPRRRAPLVTAVDAYPDSLALEARKERSLTSCQGRAVDDHDCPHLQPLRAMEFLQDGVVFNGWHTLTSYQDGWMFERDECTTGRGTGTL